MADSGFFGSLPLRPAGRPQSAFTAPPAHEPLQDWSEFHTATAEIQRRGPSGETKESTAHQYYPFLRSSNLFLDLEGTKIPTRLRHIRDRLYRQCYFDWNDIITTKRVVDEIDVGLSHVSALLNTPLFAYDRVEMETAKYYFNLPGYHENFMLYPDGWTRQPTAYVTYGPELHQDGIDYSDFDLDLLGKLLWLPYFMIDLPVRFSVNDDGIPNWVGTEQNTAGFGNLTIGEEEVICNGSYCVNALKRLVRDMVPEARRRRYDLENEIVSFSAILHDKTLDLFMHWCDVESPHFYMSYLDSFHLANVDDIERCGRIMRNMVQNARELHWKMVGM